MFNYRRELMSIAKSGGIPTNGLVLHYPFNTPVAVGGTVQDMSTSGNNGTLSGDAFVDSNGLNLGGDGNINCGHDASLDIGSGFTWCATLSHAEADRWEYIISKSGDNAGFGTHYNQFYFLFRLADGNYSHNYSSFSTAIGTKYNVALTFENTTFKLYVNGEFKYSKDVEQGLYNSASIDLHIGGGSRNFKGVADKILIYNRALSLDEIQKIQ